MPRVSIMIPTYNYGRFLGEAIQSVLDQTFQDFELIIVDDGSTDNTREIVNSFKDSRIRYLPQENHGVAAAQNTGIKASRGEYITILGADDLYLPQNLEIKVNLLDSRPDIGLVCSDAYVFDNSTGAILGRYWGQEPFKHPVDPRSAARQPLKRLFYWGCFISPQAAMVRRQVFNTVGYFDESLPTHEDWDLMVRIVQRFAIETIDIPLLKIRRHNSNLSDDQEKMYCGAAIAANKVIRSGSLSREELKLLKEKMLPQHIHYGLVGLYGGKEAAARKALLTAIRLDPRHIKLYVYVALSILGTRKFLALRKWKKAIGRHLVQSHSLGGA